MADANKAFLKSVSASADACAAAKALRIAHELEEDGDPVAARQCVQHAIALAHASSKAACSFALSDAVDAANPPAALIASVGYATLGALHREADEVHEARSAFEASLSIWAENATATQKLAELELHHGSFERACQLFQSAAALPPCAALPGNAWYAELCAEPRASAVAVASYAHALSLHLVNRCDEATPYLRRLGVRQRLSPAVWAAVTSDQRALRSQPQQQQQQQPQRSSVPKAPVTRHSGAVPAGLLQTLQRAFAVDSPFWDESEYDYRGYFSFWFDLARRPKNAVEQLALRLLPLTGCADRVVGCEWWVHRKAASRSLGNAHGHQLHFDTEEGVLYGMDEVVHPAVSSVLYLSSAQTAGPTVVLDQRYGAGTPAQRAFVSHPAEGNVLFFPGDRLHGVCPSAPPHSPSRPHRTKRSRATPPLQRAAALPRRVTLMIGFWTKNVGALCAPRMPYEACGPTPRASRACTWPSLLPLASDLPDAEQPTCHAVPEVRPAWQDLPPAAPDELEAACDAAWAAHGLVVPEARNNHFFVRGQEEFLFDHLQGGGARAADEEDS